MFLPYPRAASVGSFKRPAAAGASAPVNEINFTTTLNGGTFGFVTLNRNISFSTSTGYVKAEWWDGTSSIYGSGGSYSLLNIEKSVVSPYNNTSPKSVKVYSSNLSGTRTGGIERITISSVNYDTNKITSIDLAGCTTLGVYAFSEDVIENTGITSLTFPSAPLTTQTGPIRISGNISLTTLDISGRTGALYYVISGNTAMTSLTATNCGKNVESYGKNYPFYNVFDIRNNNLNATALNNFYTDIATSPRGVGSILVGGNPGTGTDNPSIATAKSWTVYGS
jgi:hypothetical protein